MYQIITRYKTKDGKEHECFEYMQNHVESIIGEELEKILSKELNELSYLTRRKILIGLANIETSAKILKLLKDVLDFGDFNSCPTPSE